MVRTWEQVIIIDCMFCRVRENWQSKGFPNQNYAKDRHDFGILEQKKYSKTSRFSSKTTIEDFENSSSVHDLTKREVKNHAGKGPI